MVCTIGECNRIQIYMCIYIFIYNSAENKKEGKPQRSDFWI